jgi:hypothetical protein
MSLSSRFTTTVTKGLNGYFSLQGNYLVYQEVRYVTPFGLCSASATALQGTDLMAALGPSCNTKQHHELVSPGISRRKRS